MKTLLELTYVITPERMRLKSKMAIIFWNDKKKKIQPLVGKSKYIWIQKPISQSVEDLENLSMMKIIMLLGL